MLKRLQAGWIPSGYQIAPARDWRVLDLRAPGNISAWKIRGGRALAPPGTIPTPGFIVLRRGGQFMEVWVHPQIEVHVPARRVGARRVVAHRTPGQPVLAIRTTPDSMRPHAGSTRTSAQHIGTPRVGTQHVGVTHTRVLQTGGGDGLPFVAVVGIALGCAVLLGAIAVWFRLRSPNRSRSRVEGGNKEQRPEIQLELVPVPAPITLEPAESGPDQMMPGIAIAGPAPSPPGETVRLVSGGGQEDDVGAELRLVSAEVREINVRAEQVDSRDAKWAASWDAYRKTVESAAADIRRMREWLARTRSERLMIAGELELDRRREIVNRAWGRGIFTRKHERARLIRRAFGAERQAELAQREINTRESIQEAIRTLLRETRRVERQLIRREVRAEIESARTGSGLLRQIPDSHTNTIDFASAHASMERSDTGWRRSKHVGS